VQVGTERQQQIRGTAFGMMAISVLAALAAIAIVLAVGGHLRSVIEDSSISGAGSSLAGQR
jgi:hypothetical protein